MNKKTWMLAGGGAAVLALALAWAFAPRAVEVELASVTTGPFEATIDEDGKTRIAERYVVSAPLAGRLARITLREGDTVSTGDILAALTPVLPALHDERTQRELRARVAAGVDNVQRSASRSDRAEVALDQARIELRRSEQLAQQGFIAPTKLDADRLGVLAAQREVEGAEAERRIAAHELEQARAALGAATPGDPGAASGRAFTVHAPVAGRVLRVLQTSETTVSLGAPLVELGDTARLEIVAELLTTDALAARPGSRVRIERWGGPAPLDGRVRAVEPAAFTKVSALGVEEQRVRVLIDLTSPREQWQALGDAFRVGVRIVTLAEANAVQVPVSAVFPLPADAAPAAAARPAPATAPVALAAAAVPGASAPSASVPPASAPSSSAPVLAAAEGAAHAVFVVEGGRASMRAVQVVARNGATAWVRSGLAHGQQVIVYPSAAVRDGVRISARKV
ncbi:MAG: HlyD family efflux transporter periplasmic adaptor subunit [Burkholderiales bacterium]|nr:HlyD family efflux transporter periplasmic adaptor subunit [Burkholderiales bacterium]